MNEPTKGRNVKVPYSLDMSFIFIFGYHLVSFGEKDVPVIVRVFPDLYPTFFDILVVALKNYGPNYVCLGLDLAT